MENKTNINWYILIFRNVHSNYWKYWIYAVEIFTYFNNINKKD